MRKSIVVVLLSTLLAAGCTSTVEGAPVAAAPSAGGCVPSAAPAGFSDGEGRFAISPPDGWKTDRSGRYGNTVAFVAPRVDRSPAGPFAANIGVRVASMGTGLGGAVAGFRKELAGQGGYTSTTDEEMTVGNCTPAHLFGGTFTDAGSGLQVQNLQVLVVHAGSAVIVTASALQTSWTDHETELDTAVRSLTVPA